MKKQLSASLFASTIFLVISLTNNSSATIIDTNQNSFIDSATGLEWMDFGVNNQYTFNEVVSSLSVGQLFYGWRLPTETEALDLWYNSFQDHPSYFHSNYRRDGLHNDTYIHGGRLNGNYIYEDGLKHYSSPWDEEFDAMSFNTIWREGTSSQQKLAKGLFINDIGNVSTLRYINITYANDSDWVSAWGADNKNANLKELIDSGYSTMLIKVLEPSTLAIFTLSMIALASRRFTH